MGRPGGPHRFRDPRPQRPAPRQSRPGPGPSRPGLRQSRSRLHPLHSFGALVLALALSAGCNFERRPEAQVNADPGRIVTPVPVESAATFLEDFQAARSGSDVEPSDLQPFLHSEAVVIRDGEPLPLNEGESSPAGDAGGAGSGDAADAPGVSDAWDVLTTLPGDGAAPSEVADSGVFEGSAFYVVRYGPSVETLYLARDSVGWSLRLLQRVDEGG